MLLLIPREVLGIILNHLRLQDILEVMKLNHEAKGAVLNAHYLWRRMLENSNLIPQDDTAVNDNEIQFFELYKQRYKWISRLNDYLDQLSKTHICYSVVDIDTNDGFVQELISKTLDMDLYNLTIQTLLAIKHSPNRYTNLTARYYGAFLLTTLRYEKLAVRLHQAIHDPSSYILGASVISEWVGTSLGEDRSCIPVEGTLAMLTQRVRSKINDNDAIEDKLDKINVTLYDEYGISGNREAYYSIDNSRIDKLLYHKKGIPLTIAILYLHIATSCNIALSPINFPRHFLLGYVSSTEEVRYIDTFSGGRRISRVQCLELCPISNIPDSEEYFRVTSFDDVMSRMMRNILHAHSSYNIEDIQRQLELYRLMYLIAPRDERSALEAANLSLNMGIKPDFVVQYLECVGADSELYFKNIDKRVLYFRRFLVPRLHRPPNVQYQVGSVKLHKRYHYYCVVYGWDDTCKLGRQWELQMGVDSLQDGPKQPFYHVLVDDGSERYAAQENLIDTHGVVITHREVGKYFTAFNGEVYVPNGALKNIYPEG